MLITVRKPWLLRLFGWKQVDLPVYVIASHRLWWRWLCRRPLPGTYRFSAGYRMHDHG